MVVVVGGGYSTPVLYRFMPRPPPMARSFPSTKPGASASWWSSSSFPSPLSFPALESRACLSLLCSHLAKAFSPAATSSIAACPLSGESVSGGFWVASRMPLSMGCVWFGWLDWVWRTVEIKIMAKPARIVWTWVLFSPELVPVVYCWCMSTGVGSSLCILVVIWTTGVRSGWCMSLYVSTGVVSTGLLIGLSQCFVAGTIGHQGRSLELGLSPMPKGVHLIVPSGILKSFTVLVSWPANGGSFAHDCTSVLLWRRNNPRWAPYQDIFILVVYISIVSVIVFLTLITFHHIV